MFGKKRTPEAITKQPQDVEPAALLQLVKPIGKASVEAANASFVSTESGLLVPSERTILTVNKQGVLVTDTRRVTLASAEQAFRTEQERLKSPLEAAEVKAGIEQLFRELMAAQEVQGTPLLDADSQAMFRLTALLEGDFNSNAAGFGERDAAAPIDEQLQQLVDNTSGGQVANMEGVLQPFGYSGHTAYVAARMRSLYEKAAENPERFRTLLSEGGEDADSDALCETFLPPLSAPEAPRMDGSRATPPPTAPVAYGRWMNRTLAV